MAEHGRRFDRRRYRVGGRAEPSSWRRPSGTFLVTRRWLGGAGRTTAASRRSHRSTLTPTGRDALDEDDYGARSQRRDRQPEPNMRSVQLPPTWSLRRPDDTARRHDGQPWRWRARGGRRAMDSRSSPRFERPPGRPGRLPSSRRSASRSGTSMLGSRLSTSRSHRPSAWAPIVHVEDAMAVAIGEHLAYVVEWPGSPPAPRRDDLRSSGVDAGAGHVTLSRPASREAPEAGY